MAAFGIEEELNDNLDRMEDKSIVPYFKADRQDEELLATINGYKWKVTYFSRQVNEDNLITQYDETLDPLLQDFVRINDFIINVESALTVAPAADMDGSGIIDINIIPNPNDLFLAKSPDGKLIYYAITGISKLNYNNENLFRVTYKLQSQVVDVNDQLYTTLMSSTTEELFYNEDYRNSNTKPLFNEKEQVEREAVTRDITKLTNFWFKTNINLENHRYVAYKDLNSVQTVHEPFIEAFLFEVFGRSNFPSNTRFVNTPVLEDTILTLLLRNDVDKDIIAKELLLKDSATFGTNPHLNTLLYSGVDYIVDVSLTPFEFIPPDDRVIDDFYPYVNCKTYLFREKFYSKLLDPLLTIELTVFETLILAIINNAVLDYAIIKDLIDKSFKLPKKEAFYFQPILIHILKYYMTTFTTSFPSKRRS